MRLLKPPAIGWLWPCWAAICIASHAPAQPPNDTLVRAMQASALRLGGSAPVSFDMPRITYTPLGRGRQRRILRQVYLLARIGADSLPLTHTDTLPRRALAKVLRQSTPALRGAAPVPHRPWLPPTAIAAGLGITWGLFKFRTR